MITKASTFSIAANVCNLCVIEKFYILYKPKMATINKRSELVNNCRHKARQLLDKGWYHCLIVIVIFTVVF